MASGYQKGCPLSLEVIKTDCLSAGVSLHKVAKLFRLLRSRSRFLYSDDTFLFGARGPYTVGDVVPASKLLLGGW